MGSFNIAFNSCHEVYNITSTGIWLTALFSGETLLGPAFIAQGIAMALEMQCQDTAATALSDCKD